MATVNLGRIKPVFRGAYSGSTAYVVDDIVTSGGSSYICIQAHGAGTQAVNQTAYWTQMAAAGTDVGTTITTQGDILYRDGSGLQRLAKGTAAQVLAMNAGATAPEWVAASGGKTLGIHQATSTTRTSLPSQASYTYFGSNYTQVKADSKLLVTVNLLMRQDASGGVNHEFVYDGTTHEGFGLYTYDDSDELKTLTYSRLIDGASSTGSKAYTYKWNSGNSGNARPAEIWNPNSTDDARLKSTTTSTLIIQELDF